MIGAIFVLTLNQRGEGKKTLSCRLLIIVTRWMNNDSELIERIKEGDRAAFDEFYKQYFFSLRAYARLLLYEDEAEDVVQDVFFRLWMGRERLDASLSVRGYLMRSVYNTALNVIKKRGLQENYNSSYRQQIDEIGMQHYYNPDTNETITELYNQDLRMELNKAIDTLPLRCKEVFSLSFLYDFSGKEISEKLGISLSTVENHINNALKQLRKKLIRHKNELLVLIALCALF